MSDTTDPILVAVEEIVSDAYNRSSQHAGIPASSAVLESITAAVAAMLRRETRELQRLNAYYEEVVTKIQGLVVANA